MSVKSLKRVSKLLTGTILFLCFATAKANCTVSAQGVAFGLYDILSLNPTESTGVIDVTCDVSTSYQLSLSTGAGSYSERRMENGTNFLTYNLFTDPTYSFVWGDGTGVTSTVSGTTDSSQVHYIYGRIPARQDVAVGVYTDVIVVTIQF